MLTLAFYKGSGRFDDRVIRWVTRSAFSHVELLATPPSRQGNGARIGQAWSASSRDGGVRGKEINFELDNWEFLPIPWAPDEAIERLRAEVGKPYDFAGLLGSQLLNLRRQSEHRWFCSEICAYALGLAQPQELSPGGLHRRVLEMNIAYNLGMKRAYRIPHPKR